MKKLLLLFPLLLLSSGICFYTVMSVFADGEKNTDQKELDITLAPQDVLFAINNMKPGDWAPRTLAVKNSGRKDFVYQMRIQNKGESKLFNELLLEISVGDKELYRGKLAAFTSLSGRNLTSGSVEDLDITIRFPEHLGNDFQGTDSLFAFIFTAKGKGGGTESATIPGGVGSGGEKASENSTDPTDDRSDSSPPDESAGDSDSTSPDEPSSDAESVPPEESSTKNEPPASSSTRLLANLPSTSGGSNTATTFPTSILPATSTNIFNLVLYGSVLVLFGIVLMLVSYYRRLKLEQK